MKELLDHIQLSDQQGYFRLTSCMSPEEHTKLGETLAAAPDLKAREKAADLAIDELEKKHKIS